MAMTKDNDNNLGVSGQNVSKKITWKHAMFKQPSAITITIEISELKRNFQIAVPYSI